MKRYNYYVYNGDINQVEWVEENDGDFIKYSDYKAEITPLVENLIDKRDQVNNLKYEYEKQLEKIKTLEEKNKELTVLFDLQHTRTIEVDKLWQKETNNPGIYPDLGKLIKWLMERKIDNI